MVFYRFALTLGVVLTTFGLTAQDLEEAARTLKEIGKEPLTITGGIRLGSNFYNASGIDARRDDFQWNARANLTLGFAGFSAPFSFAFSDRNQNFNLPSYTFAGISPRYKWATLHAGDRSLNLSRFTMEGITFRGGGLELNPGKVRVAAFYGLLNRALLNDLNAVGDLNGFYQRKAWGGKVGYEGNTGSLNFFLFSANDTDEENPLDERQQIVTPVANQVVSLSGRQTLGKRLTIAGELAHSATNNDTNAPALSADEEDLSNTLLGLFSPNQSFVTGQAFQLDAFYNLEKMGLRAGYERVGRGFRTLGALFFNNDSERITAGVNRNFLENKLSVALNGGLERTNLDEVEGETTERLIGSVNLNYRPTDKWVATLGYSNFRNDTKLRGNLDPARIVDSIFLAQVTQTLNGMVSRRLGSKERPAALNLVFNHQRANNIINDEVSPETNTRFTNLGLTFSSGNANSGWQWNAGVIGNLTRLGMVETRTLAPSVGASKRFFNNALNWSARTALNFVSSDTPGVGSRVFTASTGLNYRLKNSHSINLDASFVNRFGAETSSRNFSELYGHLGYGYRFGGNLLGGRRKP